MSHHKVETVRRAVAVGLKSFDTKVFHSRPYPIAEIMKTCMENSAKTRESTTTMANDSPGHRHSSLFGSKFV